LRAKIILDELHIIYYYSNSPNNLARKIYVIIMASKMPAGPVFHTCRLFEATSVCVCVCMCVCVYACVCVYVCMMCDDVCENVCMMCVRCVDAMTLCVYDTCVV